jgi:hypothetical protein
MSNFETVVEVKSRGRGGLLIQPHVWSEVQKRLRKPGSQITVDDLLQFAQMELPSGREIIHVEIGFYAFDKNQKPKEMGRRRIR